MTDSLPVQATNPMLPANETERLAALYRYQVLDTPPEVAFDRITTLAARLFKMPTVLISLVDESRAWFKSIIGFSATEVLRDATICSFAVLSDVPLIVPDTRRDDRFACNPFVQCEPGMRFYAGAPLIDRDGFNLGTLCLLDSVPHAALTAEQEATLVDLAVMVVSELELRLVARQIASVDAALIEITQGVSRVTGGAFFDQLVQHFAKVLGTDYVYIGLIEGTDPKMMRTIATCDRGNIVENLEYRLQDTPCWEAIEQRKICCHPRNVQARFPNAPMLKPLSVESYVAIPFFGSDGQILGLLGVMDGKPLANVQLAEALLTIFASRIATELERLRSIEQVSESKERLDLALIAAEMATCDADLSTGKTIWSAKHFELLGYAPATDGAATLDMVMSLIHPDDRAAVTQAWETAQRNRSIFRSENRFVRADTGAVVWLAATGRFLDNQAGEAMRFIGVLFDISLRKCAEEELRQSQALVQRQLMEIEAIYQTAPIGLTILDQDLRFVRLNQRLAEMNGIDIDDHIGRTLREIVPTVADQNEPIFNSIFTTGEALMNTEINGETLAQPEVQRTWIQNCYPLRDETGEVVAINIVVQEITDRKRAEAALAERNQELTSFAYTISHDLKAPLRAISNLSVWIEEDLEGKLTPDTQAQFDLLRSRVNRMESMIDSLLLYARAGRQEAQLETFDLAELLAEIIDSIAPPEGFKIEIQPSLPTLTTKRVFLSQVCANLVSNAIKHHHSVTGHLQISAIEHSHYHEFIIKDDGPGIAPEDHAKVFEIFQTFASKDTSDSTGIGLAIVKKIVETEQGTIRLESSLGQGTTFYVTWPKSHG